MIFPRRISDPPCAAVFAVGSRPDGKALARGIAALRERGFEVLNCVSKRGTEYGDEDRIRSLAKALKYPHCNLMIAARGGYGALRIIDQLDYQQIARARKIIVGFSDMTALSLAIFRKCRLVTFAGPMVLDHFADGVSAFTMDSFLNHIRGDHGKGTRFDLADWGVKIMRRGQAEGRLLGGNLSLLTRMIGTKYLPDLKGAILFLEDWNEHQGRLENMLDQLRLSGILNSVEGILIGQFSDCFKGSRRVQLQNYRDLLADYLGGLGVPIAYNLPFGHIFRTITLPVGLRVRLDLRRGKLIYLENPVRP